MNNNNNNNNNGSNSQPPKRAKEKAYGVLEGFVPLYPFTKAFREPVNLTPLAITTSTLIPSLPPVPRRQSVLCLLEREMMNQNKRSLLDEMFEVWKAVTFKRDGWENMLEDIAYRMLLKNDNLKDEDDEHNSNIKDSDGNRIPWGFSAEKDVAIIDAWLFALEQEICHVYMTKSDMELRGERAMEIQAMRSKIAHIECIKRAFSIFRCIKLKHDPFF